MPFFRQEIVDQIMTTISRRRRIARLAIALAMCGSAAALAPSATAAPAVSPAGASTVEAGVPPVIEVPPGQVLIGDFLGRGVQVYRCTAGAWAFVEPTANLAGWAKRPGNYATAVHFRGPSWESTDDGSLVEARVVASSPVPG